MGIFVVWCPCCALEWSWHRGSRSLKIKIRGVFNVHNALYVNNMLKTFQRVKNPSLFVSPQKAGGFSQPWWKPMGWLNQDTTSQGQDPKLTTSLRWPNFSLWCSPHSFRSIMFCVCVLRFFKLALVDFIGLKIPMNFKMLLPSHHPLDIFFFLPFWRIFILK